MNKQQQQIFDSYNQKPDQNSVENGKRKLLTNIYNICPMNNMEKKKEKNESLVMKRTNKITR